MHREEARWLLAPPEKGLAEPFVKGTPVRALENERVEYEVETEKGKIKVVASLKDTFEMSRGEFYADMC